MSFKFSLENIWNLYLGRSIKEENISPEGAKMMEYVFYVTSGQILGMIAVEGPEKVEAGEMTREEFAQNIRDMLTEAIDKFRQLNPRFAEWEEKKKAEQN